MDTLIKHRFYFYSDKDIEYSGTGNVSTPEFMGCFQRIGGLSADTDEIELKTGCDANSMKYPGVKKYGTVSLSKPIYLENTKMMEWSLNIYQARTGESSTDKRTGYIIVFDNDGKAKILYVLYESWPSVYGVEDLDAGSVQDPWVENIELNIRKFDRFILSGGDGISPTKEGNYASLDIEYSEILPKPTHPKFPIKSGETITFSELSLSSAHQNKNP